MIKYEDLYKFTKKLSVLYAEYDEELRKENIKLFEDLFKKTDNALDGRSALEKYKNFNKNNGVYYDIVFTDIDMPNVDGHQFIDEIHKINPEQVIIVISSYHEANRFIKLIEQEIESYIPKPINKENLITVLYKVSQNIIDNKLTKKHVKGMKEIQ